MLVRLLFLLILSYGCSARARRTARARRAAPSSRPRRRVIVVTVSVSVNGAAGMLLWTPPYLPGSCFGPFLYSSERGGWGAGTWVLGAGERRSYTAMGPSWQANAETAPVLPLRAYFAILTQARQNSARLFWAIFFKKYRFLRRMELSNKFLSPTYAPDLGDIAPYFFFEKIFRSDGEICVSMTPFWGFGPFLGFGGYVTETHISPSDRNIFSKKKYVAISPRSGAYVGERNLLLSAIRRSWLFGRN